MVSVCNVHLSYDTVFGILHDDCLLQLKDVRFDMGARRAAGDRHNKGTEQEDILLRSNLYHCVLLNHRSLDRLICYSANFFNVVIAHYSTINLYHAHSSAYLNPNSDRADNLLFCVSSRESDAQQAHIQYSQRQYKLR